MFNYLIEVKSIESNDLKFFKIVSKSDKEAIKKANDVYFKRYILAIWKQVNFENKILIKRF